MKQCKFQFLLFILAFSLMTITSCTNNEKPAAEAPATTTEEAPAPAHDETIQVSLDGNDQMQYDKSNISVYAGQTVVLTLKHTGKMAKAAMGHNFVLLAQGTDVDAFAEDAIKASATDYVPEGDSRVIAHTSLIGGGETTTVTFKAPEAGSYDFICSFPGHHMTMKGKFNVE